MDIRCEKDDDGNCDDCGAFRGGDFGYYNQAHDSHCKYVLRARLEEIEAKIGVRYDTESMEYVNP